MIPAALRRNPDAARVHLRLTLNEAGLLLTLAHQAQVTGTQVASILPGIDWDSDKALHLTACKVYMGMHAAVAQSRL